MKADRMSLIVFVGFSLILAASARAAERVVPDDPGCETIQGCIDLASDGDTITVKAGTYFENIDFSGKAVIVTGQQGPDKTIIDGNDEVVVTFQSGEGNDSVIDGLTIKNGGETTGLSRIVAGILCLDSSPTIRNNLITENNAPIGVSETKAAGIVSEGGSPVIMDNRISENIVDRSPYPFAFSYGIYLTNPTDAPSPVIISGNTISFHYGLAVLGPLGLSTLGYGISAQVNDIVISNNMIFQNGSYQGPDTDDVSNYGVGIEVNCNTAVVTHNTVSDNGTAVLGYGIGLGVEESATILSNIITGNGSFYPGVETYGLSVSGRGEVTADFNNVWGNKTKNYNDPSAQGAHDVSRNPFFVDPEGGDYHLSPHSPCIDAGTDAGLTEDIDGDPRPQAKGYDIGADEVPPSSWTTATTVQTSAYGRHSVHRSQILNLLAILILPAGTLLLLTIIPRRL